MSVCSRAYKNGHACCTAAVQCPITKSRCINITIVSSHGSNVVVIVVDESMAIDNSELPLSLAIVVAAERSAEDSGRWYMLPDVQIIDVRSASHWKSTVLAESAASWQMIQT